MTVEFISWSISTKIWDRAEIKLVTPRSAVRQASAVWHANVLAGNTFIQYLALLWDIAFHEMYNKYNEITRINRESHKKMAHVLIMNLIATCMWFLPSMHLQSERKKVWNVIIWLHQKSADLDLQCFQARTNLGSAWEVITTAFFNRNHVPWN